MSAHRPRRHEIDGRPYREVPFFDLIEGREWIPAALLAAILVVLYLLDAFMNHLDSLAAVCFMVDFRHRFERRSEVTRHVGKAPHPAVSFVVSLAIITAPIWSRFVP